MHIIRLIIFFSILLGGLTSNAAEEELTLLVFEANLIGKIDEINSDSNPDLLINTYYSLLPEEALASVSSQVQQLLALLPRYSVAQRAADSAELSELMDKISTHWSAIQTTHKSHFTREVVNLLNSAYNSNFNDAGLNL